MNQADRTRVQHLFKSMPATGWVILLSVKSLGFLIFLIRRHDWLFLVMALICAEIAFISCRKAIQVVAEAYGFSRLKRFAMGGVGSLLIHVGMGYFFERYLTRQLQSLLITEGVDEAIFSNPDFHPKTALARWEKSQQGLPNRSHQGHEVEPRP